MSDVRSVAERLDKLGLTLTKAVDPVDGGIISVLDWQQVDNLLDVLDQPAHKDTSDGYHTFAELYDYRMLYNIHSVISWMLMGIDVVKSKKHHDGEEPFGGGYFVVVAELPTGQVSNHYKLEHWDLFPCDEVDLPPVYDGHTPEVAADRLREFVRNVVAVLEE